MEVQDLPDMARWCAVSLDTGFGGDRLASEDAAKV
jgi:hypothetical protein